MGAGVGTEIEHPEGRDLGIGDRGDVEPRVVEQHPIDTRAARGELPSVQVNAIASVSVAATVSRPP